MENFLEKTYFNNTVQDYAIAVAIFVGGVLILRLFRNYLLNRLRAWAAKTETTIDDLMVTGLERFGLPILNYAIFYWAIHHLTLAGRVSKTVTIVTAVFIVYFVVRIILTVTRKALETYVLRQENGESKLKQISGIMIVVNITAWALGAVFLFDNLGYNVTTIITGLGIGGIAIALAAQNILGDLFNYFVIFFDRPFEVGDFIVIDDKKGIVEHIGIKTTRLKSLSGEQIVISNSNLTNSRLHNFKRMAERRIVFQLNVVYGTPVEKLKAIPAIIKNIFDSEPLARLDRVHFLAYGASSLNYEIVFFVSSPDYSRYADVHQSVNLKIYEAFAQHGIQFAIPAQTVFLKNGNDTHLQETPST
ncbi:MAG: mechanosensitive ion channel family protein [Cyclobacteriaceae bacterium]|nr:mechanosensitive ion channel family protein [Cyclobacteriaceae bacterium]